MFFFSYFLKLDFDVFYVQSVFSDKRFEFDIKKIYIKKNLSCVNINVYTAIITETGDKKLFFL